MSDLVITTRQPAKRPRGTGSVELRGSRYWIHYSYNGRKQSESVMKARYQNTRAQANKLLKKRLAAIEEGKFIPNDGRMDFEALVDLLKNDYIINERRSLDTALHQIKHLRPYFGRYRAIDMTPDRVKAYQAQRLNEGAANATINREVAYLGKMLSLAVECKRLSQRPAFHMLKENNVRQGFLDHGSFLSLSSNISQADQDVGDMVEFLYYSAWRCGEAEKLCWPFVDIVGRCVRLAIENSKNGAARVLPLDDALWAIIERRMAKRRSDCPYVFHRNGRPIKDFRDTWQTACIKTGLGHKEEVTGNGKMWLKYVGTIPHDLRRCGVRNLRRSGVDESVAMKISGHKTNSTFRRYNIVDEKDLREAMEKRQAYINAQPKAPVVVPMRAVS